MQIKDIIEEKLDVLNIEDEKERDAYVRLIRIMYELEELLDS